jgi:hypothetical protein
MRFFRPEFHGMTRIFRKNNVPGVPSPDLAPAAQVKPALA